MKSAITVLKEQFKHFNLIRRISLYELRNNNNANYLGLAWEILNPLIQISIYWFVFGFLISGGEGRFAENPSGGDRIPFLPWLVCGLIVWMFFQPAATQGSKSIYTRLRLLAKMNFPMSVIPNITIFSKFYPHLILVALTLILMQFIGYPISIYTIQLPYFIFATFAFTYAFVLLMTTLTTLIRDIQLLLQATLRMVLYLTPILWVSNSLGNVLGGKLVLLMKLNPLFYLVEGYRAAILGQHGWYLVSSWEYTLYFWFITIVLFVIGAALHMRFRRHFIDFL
ncbi:ABC transporter permease [Terribacillus saccharophilus]|uniref:Transport permease protein n=1 Tax=Terribacillus saccharophilus TaxID=361277 RepID=A0ABX4GXT6_9BACI|nr:ABC transporter permease [Terribacillus saccharophilus]PAD35240.1 teichoic acid ABC transporter permease [Terribacillus saccharophilus]PAD95989.1 teichoic acid ABC transporter permease [Terribacillus saccharophilus]PAD99687.1 teichoic acid ABC transporter permease [Terribacillus saccharophilus]